MTADHDRSPSGAGGAAGAVAVSADGTEIAYERSGSGPAVVLVASAPADRSDTVKLAALLAEHFTVVDYDRRGRGPAVMPTPTPSTVRSRTSPLWSTRSALRRTPHGSGLTLTLREARQWGP